jgi:hypothetical protein
MIRTKCGNTYRVIGNCGLCKPKSFNVPDTLVKLEAIDKFQEPTGDIHYQFKRSLIADNGIIEINEALQNAELVNLSAPEWVIAIDQAL